MSHYTTVTTKIRDEDILVAALEELVPRWAGHIERHETPQALVGWHGDIRPETAHVIIRRQHVGGASNDVGFVRGPDGNYQAIISAYDSRTLDEPWCKRLLRTYSEKKVMAELRKRGYVTTSRQEEKVGLVIRVHSNS